MDKFGGMTQIGFCADAAGRYDQIRANSIWLAAVNQQQRQPEALTDECR